MEIDWSEVWICTSPDFPTVESPDCPVNAPLEPSNPDFLVDKSIVPDSTTLLLPLCNVTSPPAPTSVPTPAFN